MLIVRDRLYAKYKNNIINKGDIIEIIEYDVNFVIITKTGFYLTIPYTNELTYNEMRCIINYINNLCETGYNIMKYELEKEIFNYLKELNNENESKQDIY